MNSKTFFIALVALLAVGLGIYFYLLRPPATGSEEETSPMTTSGNPIAVIETNLGTFKFELNLDTAPITAQNFIDLAEKGFYDGLTFHRIVPGFVIQGGDPNGDGTGGPGYTIKGEFNPELKHDAAGVVAMARKGNDPDSAGSQFYITLAPTPNLDGSYAVFGRVIEGLDVVLKIGRVPTDARDRPLEPVIMERVTIVRP
jgi:cyclophilin family peptidyl-prolyl cis-trans isomerase